MQDVTESTLKDRHLLREDGLPGRMSRQERQARVGILRNPASPPRLPARRTPLMGRWLNLRSSRRPSGSSVAAAAESVVTTLTANHDGPRPSVPVRRAADGSVQAIDIAGLIASVEGIGGAAPARIPFAASMRADADAAPPPAGPQKVQVQRAAAGIDDDDSGGESQALAAALRNTQAPAPGQTRQSPSQAARRAFWIVGIGIALAAVVLILLPAGRVLLPA